MQDSQLIKIVNEYGDSTPMYIFDLDKLKQRIIGLMDALPVNSQVCYAMKANSFLVSEMNSYMQKYEVCSPGELHICMKKNIAGEKIVYSGVNKGKEDILEAISYSVATVTVESELQFKMICDCAQELNHTVSVILRLTSGNQFGMSEEILESIIRSREDYPLIHIEGIQYFSGTQKRKKKIAEELQFLTTYCDKLEEKYSYYPNILEYGPGLPVAYFEGEDFDMQEELDELIAHIKNADQRLTWILELGRYIASNCGYYITKVMDVKNNHGKNFCIVDGGINHVNYYGQNMAMRIPQMLHITSEAVQSVEKEWCICGSLCTYADVLVRKATFTNLRIGDFIVFKNIGAYAISEGIYLFLSRTLPPVYYYDSDTGMRKVRDAIETSDFNC